MSMEKFKSFVKTPSGKLILICSTVLIVCWGFMLVQFSGGFSALFPSEEKIKNLKQDVRKLRAQVEENRKKTAKSDLQKKLYREKLITYWNEERDGLVDTVLRNTIQNAAKELELTLSALGSVRITRINHELYYAEVDNLSATAPYDVLIKFFAKLEESRPALHWRRLDLRPDNGFMRQRNNAAQSAFQITPATVRMRFHGAVRVIGYDGKLSLKEMEKAVKKTPVKKQEKKTVSPAAVEGGKK
ncbi:MAG: hypothetical protein IKA79_06945 [Lentisphaeria bacterium]|nr:hypothetical protein [Lentisphaeria bacterium]